MSNLYCATCKSEHPASEGITVYVRYFECTECGTYWEDTWCSDCDDDCPNCGTTMTSAGILNEETEVEPVLA
jgi:hypothetical protein